MSAGLKERFRLTGKKNRVNVKQTNVKHGIGSTYLDGLREQLRWERENVGLVSPETSRGRRTIGKCQRRIQRLEAEIREESVRTGGN